MIHIRLTGAFMIRVDSWRLFLYTVSLHPLFVRYLRHLKCRISQFK